MRKSKKRSIDLPKGCKDFYDLLEREKRTRFQEVQLRCGPIPPISRHVQLPSRVTVRELAEIAGRQPVQIIADLLKSATWVGGFDRPLGFERAATLLLTYGIEAQKTS